MSTPPVPPADNNDRDSGDQDRPQYGQNQPQYGQNAPQYGQNQPQYGQNAPQYGQNPQGQFGQPHQGPSPYGQPPYGQSPYGQYPSDLPAARSSSRPPQVDLAFWLIIGAGILSFISALTLAFTGGDYFMRVMEEQAQMQGGELPPGAAEGMQGILMGSAIVGGLISLGLYALVAFPVRNGKNWARILGTVFAAISVLGLFSVFTLGPVYGVMQILVILMGIVGIVLLYLPANSPYFQKQQPFSNPYAQPYGR